MSCKRPSFTSKDRFACDARYDVWKPFQEMLIYFLLIHPHVIAYKKFTMPQ